LRALAPLAIALLAAAAAAEPHDVTVLTYNVHGLPSWIAGDDPPARIPQLLAKAEGYDVVLLQEDFAHQAVVDASARHPHRWRGVGPWLPGVGQGAGLTILSRHASVGPAESAPYGVCNGWLSAANDCLADKGWLFVRLRLPDASELDAWNTHLDAGRGDADRAARAAQLERLAGAIEARSAGRALLVGGDFNLEWDDPADRDLLERFAGRLGLAIAAQTPADGWDGHLDYLLLRSGAAGCLEAHDVGKDEGFVDADARPLSDHPAIRARLRVARC
jgi:endonuclease/exonuclease/phosphatase family metal-dependent hydrolase